MLSWLTDSEGSQSTLESPRTLRNLGLDKHRANFDQTHRFISNFIYELPFGTGRRWLAGSVAPLRKALEGWQIGGIVNWQTGGPVSIFANRSTFNQNNPGLNPALLTGATFEQIEDSMGVYKTPVGVFFINPNMLNITTSPTTGKMTGATLKEGLLGAPAAGTLGTMPRNDITGPWFTQFDFSITKRTYYTERRSVDLKVNFVNAFNQANFAFASAIFHRPASEDGLHCLWAGEARDQQMRGQGMQRAERSRDYEHPPGQTCLLHGTRQRKERL